MPVVPIENLKEIALASDPNTMVFQDFSSFSAQVGLYISYLVGFVTALSVLYLIFFHVGARYSQIYSAIILPIGKMSSIASLIFQEI